jgi:hypothetical protein
MGYLQLDGGIPNFQKAIISLWFRFPSSTLTELQNYSDQSFDNPGPFDSNGIMPLLVIGPEGSGDLNTTTTSTQQQIGIEDILDANFGTSTAETILEYSIWGINGVTIVYPSRYRSIVTFSGNFYHNFAALYDTFHDTEIDPNQPPYRTLPTCIGIDSGGGLWVNFETGQQANVVGYQYEQRSVQSQGHFNANGLTWTFSLAGEPVDPAYGSGVYPPSAAFYTGHRTYEWLESVLGLSYTVNGDLVGFGDETNNPRCRTDDELTLHNWEWYPGSPNEGWHPAPTYRNEDISNTLINATLAFASDAVNTVAADVWHHVLISVDLSPGLKTHGDMDGNYIDFFTATDYAPHLFLAIDDQNKTAFNLSSAWVYKELPDGSGIDYSGDLNAILDYQEDSRRVIGEPPQEGNPGDGTSTTIGVLPTYTADDLSVPAVGKPIGLPGTATYVNNIFKCEMAEFQMWVGQSFDTADAAKRRLFIDFKRDKDGNPITDPNTGYFTMIPVKADIAAKALGAPTIKFHGTANWKNGIDTGSLGKAGNFRPTGDIKKYKPDPSIMVPPAA